MLFRIIIGIVEFLDSVFAIGQTSIQVLIGIGRIKCIEFYALLVLVPALGVPCLLTEATILLGTVMDSGILFFTFYGFRLAFLASNSMYRLTVRLCVDLENFQNHIYLVESPKNYNPCQICIIYFFTTCGMCNRASFQFFTHKWIQKSNTLFDEYYSDNVLALIAREKRCTGKGRSTVRNKLYCQKY